MLLPYAEHLDFSAVQDMLNPESRTAIVQLLLQRTLPAVAAVERSMQQQQQQQQLEAGADAAMGGGSQRTWSANATTAEEQACKAVGWIGSLTKVPCLRPVMLQLALEDLASAQHAACQLTAALPQACPPTVAPFVFRWAWQSAVEVLVLPLAAIAKQELSSVERAIQQLAAGHEAARCLPRLAAALRAAPASQAEADQALGMMCTLAEHVISRMPRALPKAEGQLHAEHCVMLLEATDAMLRTLPTLRSAQQAGKQQFQPTAAEQQAGGQQGQPTAMEQQQQQQQAGKDDEPAKWAARAAAKLVGQCWSLLWHAVQLAHGQMQLHRRLSLLQQIPGNAHTSAMAAAAWKLHSTSCRSVHWSIAQGSVGDLAQWDATLRELGGLVAELLT